MEKLRFDFITSYFLLNINFQFHVLHLHITLSDVLQSEIQKVFTEQEYEAQIFKRKEQLDSETGQCS